MCIYCAHVCLDGKRADYSPSRSRSSRKRAKERLLQNTSTHETNKIKLFDECEKTRLKLFNNLLIFMSDSFLRNFKSISLLFNWKTADRLHTNLA